MKSKGIIVDHSHVPLPSEPINLTIPKKEEVGLYILIILIIFLILLSAVFIYERRKDDTTRKTDFKNSK